ncbi:MAG: PDZ domain-containing protein, partial [Acidobacteria bacterium]|nr:PDZ domain-containing protein [Acidobacteriota bacterium]
PDYFRYSRSISYYNKGAILGFLLDLGIRHATENRSSLDDVIRRLNSDFARQDRFFTLADLRAIIADLAPEFGELDGFFDDYVSGTRELDYATYLGYAGLRLVVTEDERPSPGFSVVRLFEDRVAVEDVDPASPAAGAGLEPGDTLLRLNGRELGQSPQDQVDKLKRGTIRLRVRRGRRELQLEFAMGTSRQFSYRVEEIDHPTEEQRRVREGWLEGTTVEAVGAGKR